MFAAGGEEPESMLSGRRRQMQQFQEAFMGYIQNRREEYRSNLPPALRGYGVLRGIAPWIAFDILAGASTWELAAFSAFIAAALFSVSDFWHGEFKFLDMVGILFFGIIGLLALFFDRRELTWLETYASVLSSGVLAAVAFGSLAAVPFTEQYAEESAHREVWKTPEFRRTNRIITTTWGAAFLIRAALGLTFLHVSAMRGWLNWGFPIILLIFAVHFTARYPTRARERTRSRRPL
ncbi:hypothetical protein AB0P12_11435 [Streptomyces subrutilus]|uniref:hypothetical protein n=1 Tax=Streptomyces subrutilus TaxID=36818 RepID=UPI0034462312